VIDDPTLLALQVPYAAPPVGDMRWRYPAQPAPWDGVRRNPHLLTRCPQPSMGPAETFAGHTLVDDEDCLKCAIWAPVTALHAAAQAEELAQIAAFEAAEAAAARLDSGGSGSDDSTMQPEQTPPQASSFAPTSTLPVIVYIHGGAGKMGTCHTDFHGGETLARTQQVIFIAINYRLGILGFLAHPALTSEDAGSSLGCCGNYAIADQIAALIWVQKHVHCFGGDKNNVTVMGYSSGAQFVSTLIVSPPTRHPQWGMGPDSRPTGLFHRAVIQSGVDLPNVRKLQSSCEVWQGKSAEEWGEELAKRMNCPTEEDARLADSWHSGQLASLRNLPVETIVVSSVAHGSPVCVRLVRYLSQQSCKEAISATSIPPHPIRLLAQEHTFDEAANDCYESVVDPRGARWGGAMACLKPTSSLEALETGAFHRVPVMIGATEQDGLGESMR
jgi:para-nitrobenzyl esterase